MRSVRSTDLNLKTPIRSGGLSRYLEIIKAALEEAGASLKDVIRTRIFITRVADWEQIGEMHGEFFRDIRPASTMVQVAQLLDPDWLVEIEADAVNDADAT